MNTSNKCTIKLDRNSHAGVDMFEERGKTLLKFNCRQEGMHTEREFPGYKSGRQDKDILMRC